MCIARWSFGGCYMGVTRFFDLAAKLGFLSSNRPVGRKLAECF